MPGKKKQEPDMGEYMPVKQCSPLRGHTKDHKTTRCLAALLSMALPTVYLVNCPLKI